MTGIPTVGTGWLALLAMALGAGVASAEPAKETEPMAPTVDADLEAGLRAHVGALAVDIGERSVIRGDGLDRARAYIKGAFESAGLKVTEQTYDYGGRGVANIVADPPGMKPDSRPYIVGAHYDSVPGTPGADDNASGVAVMLELARRAAARPPSLPLRFVAFTLEEPPTHASRHQGSRVFVEELVKSGGGTRGAIVLEMVGLTTPHQGYPVFLKWAGYPEAGDFIGVVGNRASRAFGQRLVAGMRRNAALPVESLFVWFDGWVLYDTRLSDHAPFWDAGLPALMVTDTAYFRNRNYHGPGDRAETLDYRFMANLVISVEQALAAISEYTDTSGR